MKFDMCAFAVYYYIAKARTFLPFISRNMVIAFKESSVTYFSLSAFPCKYFYFLYIFFSIKLAVISKRFAIIIFANRVILTDTPQ